MPYLQQQIGRDLKGLAYLGKDTSDDTLAAMVGKRENPQADSDRGLKRHDNKLLVATLIATVTFAAGLTNVPGGFKTDGTPVLYERLSFGIFQLFSYASFILSVMAIFNESTPLTVLSIHLPTPASLIQFSIGGMMAAFYAGILAMQPKRRPNENLAWHLFGASPSEILLYVANIILTVLLMTPAFGCLIQIRRVRRIRMFLNRII